MARGGAGYIQPLIDLPIPLVSGAVILGFTAIALYGVTQSVTIAAAMTVLEIGGLAIVIVSGGDALSALPERFVEMIPTSQLAWSGVLGGAFLAFFAFAGFENMVNMAEDTNDRLPHLHCDPSFPSTLDILFNFIAGFMEAISHWVTNQEIHVKKGPSTTGINCGCFIPSPCSS